MGSHPPGVTWRLVRRSPDFPPQTIACSDCLADSCFLGPRILQEIPGSAIELIDKSVVIMHYDN